MNIQLKMKVKPRYELIIQGYTFLLTEDEMYDLATTLEDEGF